MHSRTWIQFYSYGFLFFTSNDSATFFTVADTKYDTLEYMYDVLMFIRGVRKIFSFVFFFLLTTFACTCAAF